MTAIAQASSVITATPPCPHWCHGHTADDPTHYREAPEIWAESPDGPAVGVALEREDSTRGPGAPRINIQLSRDAAIMDDGLSLDLADAEDYALAILHLVATARNAR